MILPFGAAAEITAAIPQVGRHLRAGKLLAYPTETVYGLGSAPTVPALAALARLKGRPEGKPFLLLISSREGGIAVRYTSHAGIARLVAALGEPLTSTSANRPGNPPAPGADRLMEVFGPEERNGELLVLDGGVLGNVPPSTLVDCTDVMPRLVREGAIPRAELRRAAGRLAP
jgi:L-threonylcarbamoyladenylate synthase